MIARRIHDRRLCSIKAIILFQVHSTRQTNRSRSRFFFLCFFSIYINLIEKKRRNKNKRMFASLEDSSLSHSSSLRRDLLAFYFLCFVYSTDSSTLRRITLVLFPYSEKDFSCLSAVVFHRTTREKEEKNTQQEKQRIKLMRKNKTIFS